MNSALKLIGLIALAALLVAAILLLRKGPAPEPDAPEPHNHTHTESIPLFAEGPGRQPAGTTPQRKVVGRLVDTEGQPFDGLRVVITGTDNSIHEGVTNDQGRFEINGLGPGRHDLDITANFNPEVPLGQRTLACAIDPLPIGLPESFGQLDVGEKVLPRSRPFWIVGHVEMDANWAREEETWLGDVRVDVVTPDPDDVGDAYRPTITRPPGAPDDWSQPPWRDVLPEPPNTLDENGSFFFAVETPHDPFVLRIRLKRFEPIQRMITPTPDGIFEELFQMPL